jgi:predicted RNA-binding protein with PUA-like domain
MSRAKQFWLMKVEPSAYTIDDLERDGTTSWEGVRNYQARNLLRDEIKPGDGVLFYASNADPSGVSGLAEVVREGYPDPYQFKKGHKYSDPKAKRDQPIWFAVDIKFVEKFAEVVPLAELKATEELASMMVVKRGARLSVQPVTHKEFEVVRRLGRRSG